jgi:hypothetical protein
MLDLALCFTDVLERSALPRQYAFYIAKTARRFPDPLQCSGVPGAPKPFRMNAYVDRVDWMLCFWDAFRPQQAQALLYSARTLLGFVLRDAELLRELLRATPVDDAFGRRALVVALGLLGHSVAPGQAIANLDDRESVAAACLAAALAQPQDPGTPIDALIDFLACAGASNDAIETASNASARIAHGFDFGIIEG